MKNNVLLTLFVLMTMNAFAQNTYYIATTGNNSNNGQSQSTPFETVQYASSIAQYGDTIYVLPGTYTNTNYGNGDIWKEESTFLINNKYAPLGNNDYLTVKPLIPNSVILKSDGLAVIRISLASYIRIEGFIIEGELDSISLNNALQHQFIYKDSSGAIQQRVPLGTPDSVIDTMTLPLLTNIKRPSYFNTSGIFMGTTHHIEIINNKVSKVPGEGIRSFFSDFLTIVNNTVSNCARRSATGVHGLSVYNCNSLIDTSNANYNGVRVLIAQNTVYENYQEVYAWSQYVPSIVAHVSEGKGITIQRCTPSRAWTTGKIRIENNLCYRNGYSGVHINSGNRIEIVNNTCYENNANNTESTGTGVQHGISLQDANNILVANNIVQSNYYDNTGDVFRISPNSGLSGFLTITDNIFHGNISTSTLSQTTNTFQVNPTFTDTMNYDFSLQATSPAINIANTAYAPIIDFYGNFRDILPDLGAIEYNSALTVSNLKNSNFQIYPNPARDYIYIKNGSINKKDLRVYNLLGQNFTNFVSYSNNQINISRLPKGFYLFQLKASIHKIHKN